MKTTLVIPDDVMRELKVEAARRGRTMSAMVEAAIRCYLQTLTPVAQIPPLPTYDGGKLLVDISDREKLYNVLDDFSLYR